MDKDLARIVQQAGVSPAYDDGSDSEEMSFRKFFFPQFQGSPKNVKEEKEAKIEISTISPPRIQRFNTSKILSFADLSRQRTTENIALVPELVVEDSNQWKVVTDIPVWIRSQPSGPSIGKLEPGDIVTEISSDSDWVQHERGWTVKTLNGQKILQLISHSPGNSPSLTAMSLYDACSQGDIRSVKKLINAKANVNEAANNGITPLIRAAEKGHREVVRILLLSKADIHKADPHGWTPLIAASNVGNVEAVAILLKAQADVNETEAFGRTALYAAAEKGNVSLVKQLLDASPIVDKADQRGETPLMIAVGVGHFEVIGLLLKADADVDLADKHSRTSVMIACGKGDVDILKLILAVSKSLDNVDDQGKSALTLTAFNGNDEVVRLLLDHSASVNQCGEGNVTPLIGAACGGHLAIIDTLIAAKANPNESSKDGKTALMIACASGYQKCTQRLMEEKADVNQQDRDGEPALYYARKNLACFQLIVESGFLHRKFRKNDLMLASEYGQLDMVKRCLYQDMDVNVTGPAGYKSPLILACEKGHSDVVELLLERRANVNIVCESEENRSAFHYACRGNYSKCVRLLSDDPSLDMQHKDDLGCTGLDLTTDQYLHVYIDEAIKARHPTRKIFEIPELELPESLYAVPILMPLIHTNQKRQCCQILTYFFLTLVNVLVQMGFVAYIIFLVQEKERKDEVTCETPDFLNVVAIFAYVSVSVKDLYESVGMTLYLAWFPLSDRMVEMTVKLAFNRVDKEIISGMPVWYKVSMFLFVVLPKFVIASALLVVGAAHLMASVKPEVLILNTLALTYIMEIDELMLHVFMPKNVQDILSQVPGVQPRVTEEDVWKMRFYKFFVHSEYLTYTKLGVIVCICIIIYHQYCGHKFYTI